MSPTRPRPSGGGEPDLTNVALIAGSAVLAVGGVLWLGAAFACVLAGRPTPHGGLLVALRAVGRPRDPGSAWPQPTAMPDAPIYWLGTAIIVIVLAGIVVFGWWLWHRTSHRSGHQTRRLPGMAAPGEVHAVAGRRALQARAQVVRPSTDRSASPEDVGYRLGRLRGRDLWCTVEDSSLLVGPPRMGKGLHIVVPWVLDAPGPVVTTSTRPDTLAVTMRARRTRGPVAIFDPQRLAGLPGGLAWSPVRGCETPRTALVRARGLAAGAGFGRTVSDSDFWAGQTETALRCLLHAAALDGRRAVDLYRWSLNPALAEDAVTILNRSTHAADGWADALEASIHSDPRTRDSIWLGVRQSLAALADPDVLAAVDPPPGAEFDPAEFLRSSGTLYLLASAVASGSCAPLVAAFVEDITETARALAARSPGARLDPPLLLALDEIANLTPLPSLPSLMAEGGGSGITTLAVLQSLAQARAKWGEHAADAIWDAATVKIVLGGLAKFRDLDDVARLLGEIDEFTQTRSRGQQRRTLHLHLSAHGPGDARLRAADPALRGRRLAAAADQTHGHRPRRLDRPARRKATARGPARRRARHGHRDAGADMIKLAVAALGFLAVPAIAIVTAISIGGATSACIATAASDPLADDAPIPAAARAWIAETKAACPDLPETWIAAVMAQESGFRADAHADDSNGGTWGLLQLNASIWQANYGHAWSADLNQNGTPDIDDPDIHAHVAGLYLCTRLNGVRQIRQQHPELGFIGHPRARRADHRPQRRRVPTAHLPEHPSHHQGVYRHRGPAHGRLVRRRHLRRPTRRPEPDRRRRFPGHRPWHPAASQASAAATWRCRPVRLPTWPPQCATPWPTSGSPPDGGSSAIDSRAAPTATSAPATPPPKPTGPTWSPPGTPTPATPARPWGHSPSGTPGDPSGTSRWSCRPTRAVTRTRLCSPPTKSSTAAPATTAASTSSASPDSTPCTCTAPATSAGPTRYARALFSPWGQRIRCCRVGRDDRAYGVER